MYLVYYLANDVNNSAKPLKYMYLSWAIKKFKLYRKSWPCCFKTLFLFYNSLEKKLTDIKEEHACMKNEKNIEKVVLSIRLVFLGKFYNLSDQQFFFKVKNRKLLKYSYWQNELRRTNSSATKEDENLGEKKQVCYKILCLSLCKHIYPYATVILQRL